MGAAAIVLVFLMAPTVYANSAFYTAIYVPRSPRRPNILVWPSVMNPAVADAVYEHIWAMEDEGDQQYEKRYLRIDCSLEVISRITPIQEDEIETELMTEDGSRLKDHAPIFFKNVFHKLIQWLSGEAIECGFYTIYSNEREQIYKFINSNRLLWIRALRELTVILLQVIAVIHEKTVGARYGQLQWVKEWHSSYEIFNENEINNTPLRYLQNVILPSLDIVTAWLFDYLTQRTRGNYSNWELSEDPGIVCALENYDRDSKGWDVGLRSDRYNGDSYQDKINNMADAFMTCRVKKGCNFTQPIVVTLGLLGNSDAVKIPSPEYCTHTCTDVTGVSTFQKYTAYQHAHMTTKVGYDHYCSMEKIDKNDVKIDKNDVKIDKNDVKIDKNDDNDVTMLCHPLIVEQYIRDRQIKICKSEGCKLDCCKQAHLRPALQPQCEVVIQKKTQKKKQKIKKTISLRETMTTFPDL